MHNIFRRFRFEPGWFITSDTHFFHDNVIKYCNRPFVNSEEMNEKMIEAWNNKVGPKDNVFHLGDIAMGHGMGDNHEHLEALLKRLNGKITLVVGNHDRHLKEHIFNRFEHVCHYLEATTPIIEDENKVVCVMSHYSMRVWNQSHRNNWMFFGHSHNSLTEISGKTMDVGVDTTIDYAPRSFEEICEIMLQKEKHSIDHHV